MNRFEGTIEKVESHGHLSLVTVAIPGGLSVRSIVIETPDTATYLREGHAIAVVFKETEVILCSSETQQISIRNKFPMEVVGVEEGRLLSRILLRSEAGELASVVPSETLSALGLHPGSKVFALVKTNEVMLSDL